MERYQNLLVAVTLFALAALFLVPAAIAQPMDDDVAFQDIQYFRPNSQAGLNMFEAPKEANATFNGFEVHIGGDFAVQFQGLSQSNDAGNLVNLTNNFALPTANLNLDVQVAEGVRMHLRTYLSSRNHPEAWVKGGYFQIDELNFIQEDFLSEVMDVARFRFGYDDINYGDTHFRRSDNARAIYNPFVSNYIMDAFTTEPFGEVSVFSNGFLGVAGLSNGRLNQSPVEGDDGVALYGKLGYDSQINEQVRARLTGSVYHSTDASTRDYLYGGDRAGSRYYLLLEVVDEERPSNFLPRFNPGFAHQTAFQINPFVEYQVMDNLGVELFGVFERSMGGGEVPISENQVVDNGGFTQLGGELILRFGPDKDFYLGGRYNYVTGEQVEDGPEMEITRTNIAGGWYMTPNVLAKIEYVTSSYDGAGFADDPRFGGAEFDGFVLEAVIGF
jgi:hypothetical protein